jgi:nitroreductase
MISRFPSDDILRNALSLAARAPSISDPEPWRWRVGARCVDLFVSSGRRGREADAESRDVLLSCGASLHHCVVAFAALGWRAKVERLPDPADPDHLATLELQPHAAVAVDVSLAAAIPRQRNDWRPYCAWPVSTADISLIGARAANAGVTTRRVDKVPVIREFVTQAVEGHRADYEDVSELAPRTGGHASGADSVHRNTPTSDPEPANDTTVVLALGTRDDSRLARLRAGEAMSSALLSATAVGLASCPLAEPWKSAEGRDTLHANLFGIVGFPQILLRLGWPPVDADPLPAPPRRPFLDVCQWQDDEALTSA